MKDITILFTENNKKQAYAMTQALHQNNTVGRVIGFQDGSEVLDFLAMLSRHNHTGDRFLLLLDTRISQVSGVELLKEIKISRDLKSLPVIMFSSVTDSQLMNTCHQYGCEAFINRPAGRGECELLSTLDFRLFLQPAETQANLFLKNAC